MDISGDPEKDESFVVNLIVKYGDNENYNVNRKRHAPVYDLDENGRLVKKRRVVTGIMGSEGIASDEMILYVMRERHPEKLYIAEMEGEIHKRYMSEEFEIKKPQTKFVSRYRLDEMIIDGLIDEWEREEDGGVLYELLEKGRVYLEEYLAEELPEDDENYEEFQKLEEKDFVLDEALDYERKWQDYWLEMEMYKNERCSGGGRNNEHYNVDDLKIEESMEELLSEIPKPQRSPSGSPTGSMCKAKPTVVTTTAEEETSSCGYISNDESESTGEGSSNSGNDHEHQGFETPAPAPGVRAKPKLRRYCDFCKELPLIETYDEEDDDDLNVGEEEEEEETDGVLCFDQEAYFGPYFYESEDESEAEKMIDQMQGLSQKMLMEPPLLCQEKTEVEKIEEVVLPVVLPQEEPQKKTLMEPPLLLKKEVEMLMEPPLPLQKKTEALMEPPLLQKKKEMLVEPPLPQQKKTEVEKMDVVLSQSQAEPQKELMMMEPPPLLQKEKETEKEDKGCQFPSPPLPDHHGRRFSVVRRESFGLGWLIHLAAIKVPSF